jgi:hypothetical protein
VSYDRSRQRELEAENRRLVQRVRQLEAELARPRDEAAAGAHAELKAENRRLEQECARLLKVVRKLGTAEVTADA